MLGLQEPDLASVENDGIELPNAEITEDLELPSVENDPSLTILPTNSELKGSTSEKTPVATLFTIFRTKNESPIQVVASKQKGTEIEGTSKTDNDQVSLNDDSFMKVNSNVEEQFSKVGEIVSKFEPSPSITSGDPSQNVDDLTSSFLVKRELEQLVSKNRLDHENMSLLTDFLVKKPFVCLKDTSIGDIYKGCAYNSLAELLKFLKTHTLVEVSSSCHSEFLQLLQGVRDFSFHKEWLDGVERRALSPEIQVSQDALEKLLDSKKRVTKDVEDLKHQLTSSEAVLESIIQEEALLRAPIGY
jgi:arsenate reductase-like glutaredoxin family protein